MDAMRLPAMCFAVLLLMGACSLALHAATKGQALSNQQVRTFTAADGSFSFRYSSPLVVCQDEAYGKGHLWAPPSSCVGGVVPVCQDPFGVDFTTVACVAFPAARFRGTNLGGAAFGVLLVPHVSDISTCRSVDLPGNWDRSASTYIGGVRFFMTYRGSVGGMKWADTYRYRAFHDRRCYQLQITIAASNFRAYEPGTIKRFTPAEQRHVLNALRAALQSFRFVK